jgi:Holliday junction resolvase RusA-like endonuclease
VTGRTILDTIVVGHPRPQPRARVFPNGGRQTDNKHSKLWKGLLKEAVGAAAPGIVGKNVALELELQLGMPVQDKKKHGRPHTGRRDFDNLAKAVCDALQDCGAIEDDGQISDAIIRKRYAPHPGGARNIVREVTA